MLSRALRGGVGGHIAVQNATPVMGQNQKHVKDLETDRGHGEEVDGDQLLGVILQKGAPGLRRGLRPRTISRRKEAVVARIIEFYVPAKFQRRKLLASRSQKGKVIVFCAEAKKPA